ncbi:VOC family protein [Aurantiacibacter gangjinensis]|uniref:Glyoxalase n=1 Tax=Aurantiacibacter gangjinensis TaxID=502682 RepID=A0A0G9MM65_9SPHN|nr:VOC family protein [Aurantiacibacter gangjinensis]APE27788.1 Lactoylglutathione lyase and related lyase [Aurantiacibacter gangjinensis]KLE31780.1 glyoxalase [Aurantiacibacter gangjinensis]
MFSHVMIGTNDLDKAVEFYTKVLGVLGAKEPRINAAPSGHKRAFFMHDGSVFSVSQPIDDKPATVANGSTIGFRCDSPEQVQEMHDVAVAAGATSIEAPPGLRQAAMGAMYLAYFRDLDGHKICAIHRVKA